MTLQDAAPTSSAVSGKPFKVGDVVVTSPTIRSPRYRSRTGSVAVVKRVNPLTEIVVTGYAEDQAIVKGKMVSRQLPVTEERVLQPVYEVGVSFGDPDATGVLSTDAWFAPSELTVAEGRKSSRRSRAKGAA